MQSPSTNGMRMSHAGTMSAVTEARQAELRKILDEIHPPNNDRALLWFKKAFDNFRSANWLQSYGYDYLPPLQSVVCLSGSEKQYLLTLLLMDECRISIRASSQTGAGSPSSSAERPHMQPEFPKVDNLRLCVRFMSSHAQRSFTIVDNSDYKAKPIFESTNWEDIKHKLLALDAQTVLGPVATTRIRTEMDALRTFVLVIPSKTLDFMFLLNAPSEASRKAFMRMEVSSCNVACPSEVLYVDPMQRFVWIVSELSAEEEHCRSSLQDTIHGLVLESVRSSTALATVPRQKSLPEEWSNEHWVKNNFTLMILGAECLKNIIHGEQNPGLQVLKSFLKPFSELVCMDDPSLVKQRNAEYLLNDVVPLLFFDHVQSSVCEKEWHQHVADIRETSRRNALQHFKDNYQPLGEDAKKDMWLMYNFRRRWFDSVLFVYEYEMNFRLREVDHKVFSSLSTNNRLLSIKHGLGAKDVTTLWNNIAPVMMDGKPLSTVTDSGDEGNKQQGRSTREMCSLARSLMDTLWGLPEVEEREYI